MVSHMCAWIVERARLKPFATMNTMIWVPVVPVVPVLGVVSLAVVLLSTGIAAARRS